MMSLGQGEPEEGPTLQEETGDEEVDEVHSESV